MGSRDNGEDMNIVNEEALSFGEVVTNKGDSRTGDLLARLFVVQGVVGIDRESEKQSQFGTAGTEEWSPRVVFEVPEGASTENVVHCPFKVWIS